MQFLDTLSVALSWLSGLPGVLIEVAGVGLSSLLLVLLADKKSYEQVAGWMRERQRDVYRRWIGLAASGLTRFFGPCPFGWRAFDRSMFLAFLSLAVIARILDGGCGTHLGRYGTVESGSGFRATRVCLGCFNLGSNGRVHSRF